MPERIDNHLIIGLGGTGGKVIKSFKERIVDTIAKEDRKEKTKNIRYLYIDSCAPDLNQKWMFQGQQIELNADDKVLLDAGGLATLLNNQLACPAWVGFKSDWGALSNQTGLADGAGGQIRRLGRVNFSTKAKTVVEKAISRIIELRGGKINNDVSVHIVTGLAGGTGAGSIVDITALLAQQIKESQIQKVSIYLYMLMPQLAISDGHAGSAMGVEFYQANGYSAIKELNGLRVRDFTPSNLISPNDIIDIDTNFKAAYLITSTNTEGIDFPDNSSQYRTIADTLFVKAITVGDCEEFKDQNNETLYQVLKRIDDSQNIIIDPGQNWGQSGTFVVPGVNKLIVPKEQIKNRINNLFLLNAFNKIMFENFDEQGAEGFRTVPGQKAEAVEKQVSLVLENKASTLFEDWFLTFDYLTLNKPLIGFELTDTGVNDMTFESSFSSAYMECERIMLTNKYEGATIDEKEVLKYSEASLSSYFNKNYRHTGNTGGYQQYYNYRIEDRNIEKAANFIKGRIYDKIFSRLDIGASRIIPMSSYSNLLNKIATKYFDYLDKLYTSKQQLYKKGVEKSIKEIDNIKREYVESFGMWGIFKQRKREQCLADFKKSIADYWFYTVSLKGIDFAIALKKPLQNKLLELEKEVSLATQSITDIRDVFNVEYESSKNQEKYEGKETSYTPLYNSKLLQKFENNLRKSEFFMTNISSIERKILEQYHEIIEAKGNSARFLQIKEKLKEESFDLINGILTDQTISDILGDDDEFFNVNIIDLLNSKYGANVDDTALTQLVDGLYSKSAPMAQLLDKNQAGVNFDYNEKIFVIVPNYSATQTPSGLDFYNKFVDILGKKWHNLRVQKGGPKDQMIFLRIAHALAPSNLSIITPLKKSYDKAINSSPNAKFLMHTEDASDLVDLVPITKADEFVQLILPYVMIIAGASKFDNDKDDNWALINKTIIFGDVTNSNQQSSSTNSRNIYLNCSSISGLLKSSTENVKKMFDSVNYSIIKQEALGSVDRKNKEEVLNGIKEKIDNYLESTRNDHEDKNFIIMKEGLKKVERILNKIR